MAELDKNKKEYIEKLKAAIFEAKEKDFVSDKVMKRLSNFLEIFSHKMDNNTYGNYVVPYYLLDDYLYACSNQLKDILIPNFTSMEAIIEAYNELIFHEYHDPENSKKLNI